MKFKLDLKSGIPIYVQLKKEITYAIATGQLKPGEQLPTVRQLAVDMKVNVNTISRVYSELEKEGILATKQGKGTFVNIQGNMLPEHEHDRLDHLIDELFIEAFKVGYRPDDLLEHIQRRLPRNDKE